MRLGIAQLAVGRAGFRAAFATTAVLLIAACGSLPEPQQGSFALERFFAGTSVSSGSIATLGFWHETFTARFTGVAEGDRMQLDERFRFADGERLQRWDLRRVAPARYAGTVQTEGDDGALSDPVPVDGRLTPDGAVLDYDGYAPGGNRLLLHFRHVMRERPDGTVANHVTISKLGLPIASSDVIFAKSTAALPRPEER
ncbi:DUF3833 family protein [Mangrovicella endophytica]|uniref:DUF3833 family protein n=1 Tax=Mangrovicella endophytica TaxID=2066697 RepID=UPI000C9E2874|nr:DUF3833 family protein [Mangrovicella endophytica]